jgi:hypothetical protein
LLLAAGAAYFVWEHGQDRHARPHLLCPLCWLNKANPAPAASGDASPAQPPDAQPPDVQPPDAQPPDAQPPEQA